jgi:bifunctional UDP-N-acetylglucosamine pyrophosphorylase/glucosamine-1-phosphate N-acetyltransferase
MERHKTSRASLTVLTAELEDPAGYGRIERRAGRISRIIEEEKIPVGAKSMNEVNVGTYCFKTEDLFRALGAVKPDNAKKEFFLTDTVEILYNNGRPIESITIKGPEEMIGINTRSDLAKANAILKRRIMEKLMSEGVTIEDPSSTVIYPGVKIGRDTRIFPNTIIESAVIIGKNCRIGPFARLRSGVRIGDGAEVGNFVELVRTVIGSGTKVKHHTYLGDAVVGKNVNIGAGTITANYDGKNKNRATIGDGCFVGVGAILIAPIKIGARALIGAGCVVPKNHNVPSGATVVGVPARKLEKNKNKKPNRKRYT